MKIEKQSLLTKFQFAIDKCGGNKYYDNEFPPSPTSLIQDWRENEPSV